MKDEQRTERIMDWLEGRMSAKEAGAFEEEMAMDAGLAGDCAILSEMASCLRDLDTDFEPSADFHQSLMARLCLENEQTERELVFGMADEKRKVEKKGKGRKIPGWFAHLSKAPWRRPVFAGAAAVCCLLIVVVVANSLGGNNYMGKSYDMAGGAWMAGSTTSSGGYGNPSAPPPMASPQAPMYNYNDAPMKGGEMGRDDAWMYFASDAAKIERELVEAEELAVASQIAAGSGNAGTPEAQAPQEQKIIRTGNIRLEVHSFDEAAEAIKFTASRLGGYVTNENSYIIDNRERKAGSITIKVPFAYYDQMTEQAITLGKVLDSSSWAEDVTAQFVDLQARIAVYEMKHERLLALLKESGKLATILAIENELASTAADLESLKGQLRYMQSRTDYSTLQISLTERAPETVEIRTSGFGGFVDRVRAAFFAGVNGVIGGFGGLIVWLAGSLAGLLVLALIFWACWMLWVRHWWKKRKAMETAAEATEEITE